MHTLIISYYTPDTPYEDHAAKLKRSIDRFGLERRIEPRPSKPTWTENCAQKAQFIYEMRQATQRPVLWIDADAILCRPLNEFDECTADLGIVRRKGWSFYSGQAYFGIGPGADLILEIWCRYCREYPHVYDQVSLGYAWWDAVLQNNISTLWLDPKISEKIERRFYKRTIQRIFSNSAVLHHQESRRSRSKYLNERFENNRVPIWWREAAQQDAPFPISDERRWELGLTVRENLSVSRASSEIDLSRNS